MSDHRDELRQGFGLSTTTYVVIASIVGTGILTTSGYIVRDTGSHLVMLALWVVGGGLALCGALTVAEMAAAMPRAGGEYVFMREAYGPIAGFLYGWISFLIGFSAPTAITAHASARYLLAGFGDAAWTQRPAVVLGLAAAIVLALSFVHLRGAGPGARVQNLTTLLKLATLGALIVAGLLSGRGTMTHLERSLPAGPLPWGAISVSLVFVMFSYTGWNAATYLAGEVKDAARMMPKAIVLGCAGIIVLYLLLNLVYIRAFSVADLQALPPGQVDAIAGMAAERLLGPWVARPLSLAMGIGLLATVSAFVLTGPRVYYAMARDGLFPGAAARLDPRTGVPHVAILAQAACTLLLLVSGSFENILTYAGVGLALSSFFVILALFVLRVRRPELPRPFRTPGYPVVPLLFLLTTAWMIVFAVRTQPTWSAISLGSILAGVPIYAVWQRVAPRR